MKFILRKKSLSAMPHFVRNLLVLLAVFVYLCLPGFADELANKKTVAAAKPLWDMQHLSKPPSVEWLDNSGSTRRLLFQGESYQGKPTEVFAWYAEPKKVTGKLPAMVLLHGGGGMAFKNWAGLWAERGYAAIAIDLSGNGEKKERLPNGGPAEKDYNKLPLYATELRDVWSYHGVADAILAHSLLRSLPNVDPERTGITGISWGGYLTCIVAGIDDRFKVAIPVYGCGFLHENSDWTSYFKKMDKPWRAEWIKNFDPSSHVGNAKMPMLFVNGTNDQSYPLDSYQKTYRLVEDRTLCVTVNMPHGHPPGWAPKEIGEFADVYLKNGKPFLRLNEKSLTVIDKDGKEQIQFTPPTENGHSIKEIQLHFTADINNVEWKNRKWISRPFAPSHLENGEKSWVADRPTKRPLVWFATFKDEYGRVTSSEHQTIEK